MKIFLMGISSFPDLWALAKCCWRDVLSKVMGYERMLLRRKFSINWVQKCKTPLPGKISSFALALHFPFYRVFPNHKGFQSNDHLGYIAPIMCRRSNIGYCILFIKQTGITNFNTTLERYSSSPEFSGKG